MSIDFLVWDYRHDTIQAIESFPSSSQKPQKNRLCNPILLVFDTFSLALNHNAFKFELCKICFSITVLRVCLSEMINEYNDLLIYILQMNDIYIYISSKTRLFKRKHLNNPFLCNYHLIIVDRKYAYEKEIFHFRKGVHSLSYHNLEIKN